MINNAPNLPLYDAIYRLYPYKSFLTKEGMGSVEDTLQNFQLNQGSSLLSKITNGNATGDGNVDVLVGNQSHRLPIPVGTQRFQMTKIRQKLHTACSVNDVLSL